jgi:hypothetical protein
MSRLPTGGKLTKNYSINQLTQTVNAFNHSFSSSQLIEKFRMLARLNSP